MTYRFKLSLLPTFPVLSLGNIEHSPLPRKLQDLPTMFYTSLSTITTILLLLFSLITISSTESIRCLSIPGSPRSNPIRSIPDCVRVLDAMSYDPRLRSNHGWLSGGIPPGSFGMSILPVDWIYGTCRISLGQHEPSTPVRDAFALEKVFPDAARIMSYCMLGHGRDEGMRQLGRDRLWNCMLRPGFWRARMGVCCFSRMILWSWALVFPTDRRYSG